MSDEPKTEREKLLDRLFGNPQRRAKNFAIFPGDKPVDAETLCREINRALDDLEPPR